jgi:hypothetical protein
MRHVWGAGDIAPLIYHLDIRRMLVVSLISQPRYLRVKSLIYINHCKGRLRGPQKLSRTQNILDSAGNEKRFPGCPAYSQVIRIMSAALFWLTFCGSVFRKGE